MTNPTHLIVVPNDAALKGNDEPETQETLLHEIRTGRPAGGEDFVDRARL